MQESKVQNAHGCEVDSMRSTDAIWNYVSRAHNIDLAYAEIL